MKLEQAGELGNALAPFPLGKTGGLIEACSWAEGNKPSTHGVSAG